MSDNQKPDRRATDADTRAIADSPAGAQDAALEIDEGPSFLADLTRAMQATANAQRLRITEHADERRKAHIDAIREREATEAQEHREVADRDVKGIEGWAKAEIERIGVERERRIAARKTELERRLEQHHTHIEGEIAAVEAAVVAYRDEVDRFFGRLDGESDPIAIAQEAGHLPHFPALERIGSDASLNGSSNGTAADLTQAPHEDIASAEQSAVPVPEEAEPAQMQPVGERAEESGSGAEPIAAETATTVETASGEAAGSGAADAGEAVAAPATEATTAAVPEKAPEKTTPVPVAAAVTAWDSPGSNGNAAGDEGSDVPVGAGAKVTPRSSGAVIKSVQTHRPIGSWLKRSNNPD
jgi:hypothetical protein